MSHQEPTAASPSPSTTMATPASVDGFPLMTDDPASTALTPTTTAKPVEAAERVASVDLIRGVALMGILAMNIVGFAWPWGVYEIPILDPNAGHADTALWAFNHLVFDTKMMTLFSMLFGAGLVLMSDRADGRKAGIRGFFYRRIFWLLVIGLIHSYLIWDGDVLVLYASCGFFLYPFRHASPWKLIVLGIALNLILVPIIVLGNLYAVPYMKRATAHVEAETKAGRTPPWWEQATSEIWVELKKEDENKREDFLKEIAAYRSTYVEIVRHRAQDLFIGQTLGFVFGGLWFAGGRMLLGMGLMKLGVFSASLSRRTYLWMAVLGYGIGLPLLAFDAFHEIQNRFFLNHRLSHAMEGWPLLTLYGSMPIVFGHIGAVMLIYQSGALSWLTRRLAAAGRMALSNYLFDSIVCTTIFYGYGFDLFGTLGRPALYAIVVAIWSFQLWLSPIWLRHFRFGPAEWLWRSLTYWKLQPFRAGRRPELAAS